jgi:hypothetical protein
MGWTARGRVKDVIYQVLQYKDGYRVRRKRMWGWQSLRLPIMKTPQEAIAAVDEWRNPKPPIVIWEES